MAHQSTICPVLTGQNPTAIAHSKRSHEAMADSGSAALYGADQLWKFQLRREHNVLLEKIEEIGRSSQAMPAVFEARFKDFEDSVQTLIARNIELETTLQQFRNDRQPFIDASLQPIKNELQQFKEKAEILDKEIASMKPLLQFSGLRAPDGEFIVVLTGSLLTKIDLEAQCEMLEKDHQERLQKATAFTLQRDQHFHEINSPMIGVDPHLETAASTSKLATSLNAILGNASKTTLQPEAQAKVVSATDAELPAPTPLPKPNRRAANRKSSTTHSKTYQTRRNKAANVAPPAPPIAKPTPSKLPRLMQGPGSVLSYYIATDKKYPEYDRQGGEGVWFVNTFIAGLSAEADKKALIAVLKNLHPSMTIKGRMVEIRCWWEDVEDGLVKAGLIPEQEKDDIGPSAKRRKN